MEGTIKVLKTGFGFINVEGRNDVFFHANSLEGVQFDALELDQTLSFETEIGKNNKEQAVNVTLVK